MVMPDVAALASVGRIVCLFSVWAWMWSQPCGHGHVIKNCHFGSLFLVFVSHFGLCQPSASL